MKTAGIADIAQRAKEYAQALNRKIFVFDLVRFAEAEVKRARLEDSVNLLKNMDKHDR